MVTASVTEPVDGMGGCSHGEPEGSTGGILHWEETRDGEVTVLRLPESGCTARLAVGSHGRRALEVYLGRRLYDVVVAGSIGSGLIRGAVRFGGGRGGSWTLAWGELPGHGDGHGEGDGLAVAFGSWRRRGPDARLVSAGGFWLGETAGAFRRVEARGGGAAAVAPVAVRLGRRALRG